ncbi:MAG: hypothetical protein KW788_04410 [Candidatus Doudnabacteria bacterium]|nr:hypothetical protein [Candidatus Doudnabacteria bacterium]
MARDCEVLSTNARAIFEKLKVHFPPDPWHWPMWNEEGLVEDNGRFDLRTSADRQRLIDRKKMTLSSFVENSASVYMRRKGSLDGFEIEHFGLMIKNEVELLLILYDLDFQIETGDLVDA